jgi:hypothetical protein
MGSTMGGSVGLSGTTHLPNFIGVKATTGDTAQIPCIKVTSDIEFIVPLSSSESAVSTTNVGNHVAVSSSGTSLVASATGVFKISAVYATSGAAYQFFKGYFVGAGSTI